MKFCPECQRDYPLSQRFCLEDGRLLSLRDPYHLVGRTLADKYRLDALVGIGGMGAVYSAHHLGIDRRVAIKILQPNMALGNEQLMGLFEREARMAGHLTHENIANVMDAGRTTDGLCYIAMEWLEGRTLEDVLLEEAPMSFERSGAILYQIAAALDEAHLQRIVHRDLKPSNVMLVERPERGSTGSPQVKVLDFGIAKVVSETTAAAVSAPMGTPHYASPEQFKLGGHIDGRADIYSLGVVLYRMLSGEVPFQTASMHELVQRQLNDPPPPLRTVRRDAPEKIEKLLNRMLAKEPDDRPQSASAAAHEYLEIIGMTPADTRDAMRSRDNATTAKFDLPTRVDIPRSTNEYVRAVTGYLRSHRKWSAVAAIVIVAALAAGLAHYWRSTSRLGEDRRKIAFANFENRSGNSQFDVLQRIAPQLLIERLSQVPELKIKYFQQAGDPLPVNQAAQRVNARSVLSGAINQARTGGGGVELTASLEDISPDGTRGRQFFSASASGARNEDVFSMVDQLSSQIARHYGVSLDNVRPVSDLTTRSFDAYQYYQSGYDRVLTHDFNDAVKSLENATNIDEKFALAWLELARAHQFSNNPRKAKEAVDRAYELRDRLGERERMFVEGYYQWLSQRQRPKAIENFERMLTLFPSDKQALLSAAIVSREARQYDKSIEFARRATSEDPRFGPAWNTMGYSYLLKKDYANAIDAFKRYGEAEPQSANPSDSLGDTYIEARLYDEALAAYQRSFEIKPDFFYYGALWKRAEVYFRKGDLSAATSNAEQFVRNTSDRYRYLGELTLARVSLYQGKLSDTLDHFKKALMSTGASELATAIQANVLWREGLLLAGLRQFDKALELMEESRKLDPKSNSRVWPWLTTLAMSGKFDQALQEFTTLELQKGGATDFELRAYDAQVRGDYATAIGLWKNLREQAPAISRGYDLGRAYLALGQNAEAERELREHVKAAPVPDLGSMSPINPIYDAKYILGHYELARVLEANGKPDEARRYYQMFLGFWGSGDLKLEEIETARKKLR